MGAGVKFARTRSPDASGPNRLQMKSTPVLLFTLSAAALLTFSASPTLFAQTDTTTTVIVQPTPTVQVAPIEAAPAQQTTTTVTTVPVQPTPVVIAPAPGQHVAEIELVVSRGSVQAYFGQASRGERVKLGGLKLDVKLPSTATVTKVASRDDDATGSKHVTPDNPWHVVVPFDGTGRFVFNIVDWSDDPVVASALVKIDGVVVFSGHGSEDDLNGWAQKVYGPGVHKTGSREIAFVVPVPVTVDR